MWDEFQWTGTGGQNHQHLKNHPPIVPSDPHGRNITLQASQAARSEWSSGTSMLEGVEGWFKWLETLETPVTPVWVVEWCFVCCKNVLNGGYKVKIKSWEVQFRVSAWCFTFRETRRPRESSSCWVLIRMWFTRQQYGRSKVSNPTNFFRPANCACSIYESVGIHKAGLSPSHGTSKCRWLEAYLRVSNVLAWYPWCFSHHLGSKCFNEIIRCYKQGASVPCWWWSHQPANDFWHQFVAATWRDPYLKGIKVYRIRFVADDNMQLLTKAAQNVHPSKFVPMIPQCYLGLTAFRRWKVGIDINLWFMSNASMFTCEVSISFWITARYFRLWYKVNVRLLPT